MQRLYGLSAGETPAALGGPRPTLRGEILGGTALTAAVHAASSVVLNATKTLAGIPDKLHLLSPMIIQSIATLKQDIMKRKTVSLDLEETLIALSIAGTTNPMAELAVAQLSRFRGCEMHMTHIPTPGDEAGLRTLGVNLTTGTQFTSERLFTS